ncbi:hypothetical protein C4D60_Mb08t27520 [Musa balbisiana]|uniref:Uncharacterized protein n=1 Tax=Musa balbisiana TaxID=52838 RepID=A0A4S8K6W8_MUSBA|nr:hypothetical protein C4D60_Mb08t27520 [Musa balbisiana]
MHTLFVSRAYQRRWGSRVTSGVKISVINVSSVLDFAADQRRFRKTSGRNPTLDGARRSRSSRTAHDVKSDVSLDAWSAPSDVYEVSWILIRVT